MRHSKRRIKLKFRFIKDRWRNKTMHIIKMKVWYLVCLKVWMLVRYMVLRVARAAFTPLRQWGQRRTLSTVVLSKHWKLHSLCSPSLSSVDRRSLLAQVSRGDLMSCVDTRKQTNNKGCHAAGDAAILNAAETKPGAQLCTASALVNRRHIVHCHCRSPPTVTPQLELPNCDRWINKNGGPPLSSLK